MKKWEYQFIKVPKKVGFKTQPGDTFEDCKEIICKQAENGWRLKQVVVPLNEKSGVYNAYCYQIIFEREVEKSEE